MFKLFEVCNNQKSTGMGCKASRGGKKNVIKSLINLVIDRKENNKVNKINLNIHWEDSY